MLIKMVRTRLIIFSILIFLSGCTMELRSPIKISRTKEEEKTSPPPRVVYAPPPPAPTEPVRPGREPATTTATPYPEQPMVIRRQPAEEPLRKPAPSREMPTPTYQADTSSPEQIVILSSEYLANTRYGILGKVSVKDVSENGFSKKEAKEALKFEAFRRFGRQAKGITNVTYQGETSFFGSERYYEASGDVVTWAETEPTFQSETAMPPPDYDETMVARREPVPSISVESLETERMPVYHPPVSERYPEQGVPEKSRGIASPGNILILSDQDLIGYDFWIIGKVTVKSKSKDGFDDMDQANRALKVEAFRQYGSNARGIINVTHEKKRGLFNLRSKKLRGASGNVVTWKGTKTTTRREQYVVQSPVSTREASRTSPVPEPLPEPIITTRQAYILVLSSDDLVALDFKFLGRIKATDDSDDGFNKKSAINALKVEAYKRYGNQARGITNIDFKRKKGIFNFRKFNAVYADVVTWESDQSMPQVSDALAAPPVSPPKVSEMTAGTPPVLAPDASEETVIIPLPEYTVETVDPEVIMILDVDEILTPNYKRLGMITVKAPTRYGFKEFEANTALKKEALKQYGSQVQAIINVEYERARAPYSLKEVVRATGEAITW